MYELPRTDELLRIHLELPVESLPLSDRARAAAARRGFTHVRELVEAEPKRLLSMGRKNLREVRELLWHFVDERARLN